MIDKFETIEEKTYRITNAVMGVEITSFDHALISESFQNTCKTIAIAIAEEREACAKICEEAGTSMAWGCAPIIRARS